MGKFKLIPHTIGGFLCVGVCVQVCVCMHAYVLICVCVLCKDVFCSSHQGCASLAVSKHSPHEVSGCCDNAKLMQAVNSHSPGEKCFACSVNYTVRRELWGSKQPDPAVVERNNRTMTAISFSNNHLCHAVDYKTPFHYSRAAAISSPCHWLQSEMERLLKWHIRFSLTLLCPLFCFADLDVGGLFECHKDS